MKLTRDEYRTIKQYNKTDMERWLTLEREQIYNLSYKEIHEKMDNDYEELRNTLTICLGRLHKASTYLESVIESGDLTDDEYLLEILKGRYDEEQRHKNL